MSCKFFTVHDAGTDTYIQVSIPDVDFNDMMAAWEITWRGMTYSEVVGPAAMIDHRAVLKAYMAAVLDYESITFVDRLDLSALSDEEHAELLAIEVKVNAEAETK